jgi:hypothetical protein
MVRGIDLIDLMERSAQGGLPDWLLPLSSIKASLVVFGMKRILSRLGDQLVNEGMQPLPTCEGAGLLVF